MSANNLRRSWTSDDIKYEPMIQISLSRQIQAAQQNGINRIEWIVPDTTTKEALATFLANADIENVDMISVVVNIGTGE